MIFNLLASFLGFSSVVDLAISTLSDFGDFRKIHATQNFANRFGTNERQ